MDLPDGFTSHIAHVNGIELHYVRGGSGPALLLIHGFPQDWYEWRGVMPRLTLMHTVIAVDLRGVGESEAPQTGYDAPTLAEDLYQLVGELALDRVTIVGHDIGGWVAYAFARSHPARVSRVVISRDAAAGHRAVRQTRYRCPDVARRISYDSRLARGTGRRPPSGVLRALLRDRYSR